MANHNADVQELERLNANYVRSAEDADVHWYEEHLAEDFLISSADGSLADKRTFLDRIARGNRGKDLAAIEPRIRILGDVALIHAGFRYTRPDGSAGNGRYTDVWARRDERWVCVCAHFNRF